MSQLNNAIQRAGSSLKPTEDGFVKEFVFADDFIGFDGHFPGNPILPAMVQLMVGALTAREAAGTPLPTQAISRAKFVRQVRPNERLVVTTTLKSKEAAIIAPVTIYVGDETAATFIVTFSEGNDE